MTRRTDRLAEAIRRLTSEIVQRHLKDPRIKGFITVTKVEVTGDLRLARIYYSVLGDEKKKKLVTEGLKSAKNFIRKYIGDELKLRYAPDILLVIDKSFEYKERIDKVLKKIHKEVENGDDRKHNKSD
ncbi:MAG: 30S ribosome-binding factor RbfA [Candidatus Omnitrophota bacterium]|nr:MAG: 30S ribosome-binding factor RbfA [Candidatus Omnitrophota bacterium]